MRTGPLANAVTRQATTSFSLQFNSFTETSSAVVMLVGATVLVGWALDNTALKSLSPGLVSVKPNAAVAFLLAGISLWLQRRESVEPRKRTAARTLAAAVCGIGVLTFSEYVFGLDLGIDQLLFRESTGTPWTSHPGRMAPMAALDFALLGVALFYLDAPRPFWRIQVLTLTAVLISLLSYLAYLYALELLHGTGYYTHMAFQSTVAFCVLAAGILFSRPDRGLMAIVASDTTGGGMARRLLPAALVVPSLLAWIPLVGQQGGYYGSVFGLALLTVANIVALTVLVLWSARSLYRADLERQQVERQIRSANVELNQREHALREALASLTESHEALKAAQLQLIQAEKMESVGRLAAGVAHEVKNPLAILQSGVDYLGQHLTGNHVDGEVLDEMAAALQRADSIIAGLLDFSAPRDLELDTQDLNAVVDQALLFVRHALEKGRVNVVRELAADLPRVGLDKPKAEQVFVNVFLNAIQAMPGGGTLTVRTHASPSTRIPTPVGSRKSNLLRDTDTVVVAEVDDTGSGIPESQLRKIFDPFFTTREKGTGLGLTVTKAIVALHRGLIDVRNRAEGGTRVTIVFRTEGSRAHESEKATAHHR